MERAKRGDVTTKINGIDTAIHFLEGDRSEEKQPLLQSKLIPREELDELGGFLRRRGLTISFTTGVYDMIHVGHARYLQLARSLGDVLVVGLNTDDSVKRLKGFERPILSEQRRAEMLSFLEFVDYITPFPEDTGAEVVKILKPSVYLCVEGSWEDDIITKKEVVAMAQLGGEIYYTPRQNPSLSTTAIIGRIETRHGNKLLSQFTDLVSSSNE